MSESDQQKAECKSIQEKIEGESVYHIASYVV